MNDKMMDEYLKELGILAKYNVKIGSDSVLMKLQAIINQEEISKIHWGPDPCDDDNQAKFEDDEDEKK